MAIATKKTTTNDYVTREHQAEKRNTDIYLREDATASVNIDKNRRDKTKLDTIKRTHLHTQSGQP